MVITEWAVRDGFTFWVIVLLDLIMLAVIGLQTIWRQRMVQLVLVAICVVAFTLTFFFVVARAEVFDYYFNISFPLEISLFLTTGASIAVLVYLIRAVSGTQRPSSRP